MVERDVEPVEIRARRQSWFEFEITPSGLTFALALAVTVGTILGYLI